MRTRNTPKGIPQHPDDLLSRGSAAPTVPRESFLTDAFAAQSELQAFHEQCRREPGALHEFPHGAFERLDKMSRHTHESGGMTFEADKDFGR